jgi:DNA polymerase III alpha subunit
VLITNEPMRRHVACERSGGETDRLVTQVDMHNGIDELGLIKFDILGNGSLSVLRDALAQLEEQGAADPQVWDLEKCYADEAVKDVIRKGRTKGIFYIESPAQTRLNKKSQAETFEEITITSSLVRPAGTSYTATFVERERKRKQGIRRPMRSSLFSAPTSRRTIRLNSWLPLSAMGTGFIVAMSISTRHVAGDVAFCPWISMTRV